MARIFYRAWVCQWVSDDFDLFTFAHLNAADGQIPIFFEIAVQQNYCVIIEFSLIWGSLAIASDDFPTLCHNWLAKFLMDSGTEKDVLSLVFTD